MGSADVGYGDARRVRGKGVNAGRVAVGCGKLRPGLPIIPQKNSRDARINLRRGLSVERAAGCDVSAVELARLVADGIRVDSAAGDQGAAAVRDAAVCERGSRNGDGRVL